MLIVGITGKKFSGKDTFGNYLVQNHGFIKYSFAHPIKEICKILFGFSEEQVNGEFKEVIDHTWKVTPRQVLQVMGTELFQYDLPKHIPVLAETIGRSFWVKLFELWIQKNKDIPRVVITDTRFVHESEFIKKQNGIIVKVNRDTGKLFDSHASEVEIDKIQSDFTIENNADLNWYINQIELFVAENNI